ncbi:putative sulfate exporter family transporter, partial [Streptococcus pneumoniae]|uniref:putative sulfate exporter family transporter n=1 Tax=Streptococcus pneumoniae TaxID=1313 RepID=UPI0021D517A8
QVMGYPEHIRPGITFASKRLLKFAIILYGLKLNMGDILGKGWKLLLIDIIVIIFSISLTLILNQIIKGNQDIFYTTWYWYRSMWSCSYCSYITNLKI